MTETFSFTKVVDFTMMIELVASLSANGFNVEIGSNYFEVEVDNVTLRVTNSNSYNLYELDCDVEINATEIVESTLGITL